MGYWGPGVFDSDQASDYLGSEVVGPLLDTVRAGIAALDGETNVYAVNRAIDKLIPAIGALRALAVAFATPVCVHMQRSQMQGWRDRYLRWFDAWAAEEGNDEFFDAARNTARREFEALIEMLNEWPEEDWRDGEQARLRVRHLVSKEHAQNEYAFRLILAANVTPQQWAAVLETGLDDGAIQSAAGSTHIHLQRQADSLQSAIKSAVEQVTLAGIEVTRVEIDPRDMLTQPETWRALRKTRRDASG